MKTLITLCLTFLVLFDSPAFANNSLTPAQIQRIWAAQGVVTGTFRTQYNDGSIDTGTFTLNGPTQLVMNYPSTHSRTIFSGDGILLEDTNFPANNQFISDSRLGDIFSSAPSFAELVNLKGAGQGVTMIGFTQTDFTLKLYFSNVTGKLSHFAITDSGEDTITEFSY